MKTNPLFVIGSERFFEDGRQPAGLVARLRVVVDLAAEVGGIGFPPLDELDDFLAHLPADGPARQQMLGAVNLGRLAQHHGPALGHQEIGGDAQCRVS
jgi:hypothetical protein